MAAFTPAPCHLESLTGCILIIFSIWPDGLVRTRWRRSASSPLVLVLVRVRVRVAAAFFHLVLARKPAGAFVRCGSCVLLVFLICRRVADTWQDAVGRCRKSPRFWEGPLGAAFGCFKLNRPRSRCPRPWLTLVNPGGNSSPDWYIGSRKSSFLVGEWSCSFQLSLVKTNRPAFFDAQRQGAGRRGVRTSYLLPRSTARPG